MAKIFGRKALPLPDALLVGLKGLGMIQVERLRESDPPTFRSPRHTGLVLTVTRSNMPGSDEVVAAMRGSMGPTIMSPDTLIRIMEGMLR